MFRNKFHWCTIVGDNLDNISVGLKHGVKISTSCNIWWDNTAHQHANSYYHQSIMNICLGHLLFYVYALDSNYFTQMGVVCSKKYKLKEWEQTTLSWIHSPVNCLASYLLILWQSVVKCQKVGEKHNFMSMLNNRDGLEVSKTTTMIYFELASLDILFADMWAQVG